MPPVQYKDLCSLVNQYNKIPTDDKAQQLFYLQKINYMLNTLVYNEELFLWVHNQDKDGWRQRLLDYDINPYGSFFLKTYQFAQAVAVAVKGTTDFEDTPIDFLENRELAFKLVQQRDVYFTENTSYEACKKGYLQLSCQLNTLSRTSDIIQNKFADHLLILESAQGKIEHIIYPNAEKKTGTGYKTEPLGNHVNNYNFKFEMKGWEPPFIFCAENRDNWEDEQKLHGYPVSTYFINEYAGFMMAFKEKGSKEEEDNIVFQPVSLSQFANQGNLADVAKRLRKCNASNNCIATYTGFYFKQLIDFCTKLVESKHYHPDIKLTNFLVDRNRIRVSDRKTILNENTPHVKKVRSTPLYAPDEFLKYLNLAMDGFNYKAINRNAKLDMEPFMAYQLGMALKEFLILTQQKELPHDFRDPDSCAASSFKKPSRQIANFSLLIKELTREEPGKRLKISTLQSLLIFILKPTDEFYNEIEKILPSSELGIQDELDEITQVIESDITGTELLKKSNLIFNKIKDREPREHRLIRMAEKLSVKCYHECSENFFQKYVNDVDQLMETKEQFDWNHAPWYRKLLQMITFGLFPVRRTTTEEYLTTVEHNIPIKDEAFQIHFPQLYFLPEAELKGFDETKIENFSIFIQAYKDEIEDTGQKKSPENGHLTPDSTSTEFDTETTKFNDSVDTETTQFNDSVDTGTTQFDDSIDTGTTQFNESSSTSRRKSTTPNSVPTISSIGLFGNDKKWTKQAQKSKLEWVGSHRSIFANGDSTSCKGKKQRAGLSTFTFEPLTEIEAPKIQ